MVYKWKIEMFKTDAQTAGQICEQLEKTVGLTAKNLLDASRPADAPLHNEFEWNDSVAAEKYRENQAGHIIRNLAVCEVSGVKPQEPVRAFFKVSDAKTYESTSLIVGVKEKKDALLDTAMKELEAFKRKFHMLDELCGVFSAIDALQDE